MNIKQNNLAIIGKDVFWKGVHVGPLVSMRDRGDYIAITLRGALDPALRAEMDKAGIKLRMLRSES